jgi:carbonic anhydrase
MKAMPAELSRRSLVQWALAAPVTALAAPALAAADPHAAQVRLTPDEALERLRQGNAAFVSDHPRPLSLGRERRSALAASQAPFAVLVSCSDSRVPPELVFGCGLGELFTIRVAGNTIDTTALGSIEYAVGHLGAPLVVVMGHERCGAVAAAAEVVQQNTRFPGAVGAMLQPIIPAVLAARDGESTGDLVDQSVRENVRQVLRFLQETASPALLQKQAAGGLRIVGARYDLDDGVVDFFETGEAGA